MDNINNCYNIYGYHLIEAKVHKRHTGLKSQREKSISWTEGTELNHRVQAWNIQSTYISPGSIYSLLVISSGAPAAFPRGQGLFWAQPHLLLPYLWFLFL